jgi:hypothetical protein
MAIALRDAEEPHQYILLKLHICGGGWGSTCGCVEIERVYSYKYLGVIVDSKVQRQVHELYVRNRLSKLMYAFSQLGTKLNLPNFSHYKHLFTHMKQN